MLVLIQDKYPSPLFMTSIKFVILLILVQILPYKLLYAQFINLQLTVESEISTTVEQNLNFGELTTNTGLKYIELGDLNMGVFSIRAYHTQTLFLELDVPEFMVNANPAITDSIPIELNLAYNNSGQNDPARSTTLINNRGFVDVRPNNTRSDGEYWKQLYLYVYGVIEIGNIQNGDYYADIILNINYD